MVSLNMNNMDFKVVKMGWERILKEEKRWVITLYFWTDEGTFFWRVLEKYNETREFEGTLEEAQDYADFIANRY